MATPPLPPDEHDDEIAADLGLRRNQVAATLRLLADACTVPFIARYRKEATGELDEVAIRAIAEAGVALRERDARRQVVRQSLVDQKVLTPELAKRLDAAKTRAEVEDLYLPYRPKRRTRATVAKERGLAPLADAILAQGDARAYQDACALAERAAADCAELADATAAWAGAQDIVAEQVAERAEVRALARQTLLLRGTLTAQVLADKAEVKSKFEQYYDYEAPVQNLAGHRFLAVRRGEREGFLRVRIAVDAQALAEAILPLVGHAPASAFAQRLAASVTDATGRLLLPSVETDVRVALKAQADKEAVGVFGDNLRNLLLAAPLGPKAVLGIDPGLRTGCKCAAISPTGALLGHATLYLSQGQGRAAEAVKTLLGLLQAHRPDIVAVGNGTAGRETEAFVREVLRLPEAAAFAELPVVAVSEAGASVYSASDLARAEFPDLDLTVRGAVSIARRLQDPLAELVKIDPKAIGVGQYQHDVHQPLLARKLDEVVESSVNHVGVALNTASAALLARVAGIGPALAARIVAVRHANGPFRRRASLLEVPGLGQRTYEQAAGFLRIDDGDEPLDASAVHPERYGVVAAMARDLAVDVRQLVGNADLVQKLEAGRYLGGDVGEATLRDIVAELARPGRDPRADFTAVQFDANVRELTDLHVGMQLEGVVTNVTAFGAFVDVGVHQDGLVHISELAERFVRDPHEVVHVGQRLKVRVLEIDLVRKRIALSARPQRKGDEAQGRRQGTRPGSKGAGGPSAGGLPSAARAAHARAPAQLRHNPFAKLRPI